MIFILRYVFRCQLILFAFYLIRVIGGLQQFEVRPWAFIFIFNLVLLFFMFWPDPRVFMDNSQYLVRFFPATLVQSRLKNNGSHGDGFHVDSI